jgi:small subunit ribosomal protein S2
MSQKITIQDLMESGVHFGHQVKRWNPKMKNYVYGTRNGISIIDLTKTMRSLAEACNFLQTTVYNGGNILFVGTKRQAQEIVKQAAENSGMYYVSERWLGGTLTNNTTIRQSINRMYTIDKKMENEGSKMTKKELASLNRKSNKLHRNLDGISSMKRLPSALVVVDTCKEEIAVKEARKLKIPIIAIVDTNGNPEEVEYPIPGNDDAIRSIRIMTSVLSDSITVAAELYRVKAAEEKAERAKRKAVEDAEKAKRREEKKQQQRAAKKPAAKKPFEKKEAKPFEKKAEPKIAVKEEVKPVAKKAEPKTAVKEEAKPVAKKAEPKTAVKEEAKPVAKKTETAKPAVAKKETKPVEKKAEAKKAEPKAAVKEEKKAE